MGAEEQQQQHAFHYNGRGRVQKKKKKKKVLFVFPLTYFFITVQANEFADMTDEEFYSQVNGFVAPADDTVVDEDMTPEEGNERERSRW